MHLTDMLHWFTSDQGLMAMLSQNWPLGVALIAAILFIETGIVVMPFLPGDSLLFATGAFLSLAGVSPIVALIVFCMAAIAGDAINYAIGRSALGQTIIRRQWVKQRHLDKTRDWFDRYGGRTVTIARFVPIVRTVAPFMAGLIGMHARQFFIYNVAGGIAWCSSLLLAGFWLGRIPWVRTHLHWFSLAIIVVSVLPVIVQLLRDRRIERAHANHLP